MNKVKFSRYAILFEYNNLYLLFNSRDSSFLELSKDLYYDLLNFKKGKSVSILNDQNICRQLQNMHVLVTEQDDNCFYEQMLLESFQSSFYTGSLSITFAPTVWCNLKCPYCFETHKYQGIVSQEICDKVIDFISEHKFSKGLNLTWYGGEPLLAINRIDYFLNKLRKKRINIKTHSIITNGTLLKGSVLDVFKKTPLDFIQITLDGNKKNHDRIRVYRDGSGSFDEIISNLDTFCERFHNTHVSIRVNTGNHNIKDYLDVYKFIHERYSGEIHVYPGILVGDNDCGFTSQFFTNNGISDFYLMLIRNHLFKEFPHRINSTCSATSLYGYVIGPKGEIYKCWEDVGFKEKEVGSVLDGKFSNRFLFLQYMLHGTFRDSKSCKMCSLLPICDGGCPRHRIENRMNGRKYNLCSHFNLNNQTSLKELLYLYYCEKKNQFINT